MQKQLAQPLPGSGPRASKPLLSGESPWHGSKKVAQVTEASALLKTGRAWRGGGQVLGDALGVIEPEHFIHFKDNGRTVSYRSSYCYITFLFIYFLRFYLFTHERYTQRERQRHRQKEKQAPCREPNSGLNPMSPGSRPGLKVAPNCWATGAALSLTFLTSFVHYPFCWFQL